MVATRLNITHHVHWETDLFELIAEGPDSGDRCKLTMAVDQPYRLGRGPQCDMPVPWDRYIARTHCEVSFDGTLLQVNQLPTAHNPVFLEGQASAEFQVPIGGQFVIGDTVFRLHSSRIDPDSSADQPIEEVTFDRQELQRIRFLNADKQIEVLTHLPEVIWGARTDEELNHRLVNLVLAGVVEAEAVAVVQFTDDDQIEVSHWDRRNEAAGGIRPSGRLVSDALKKRRNSVLHIWERQVGRGDTEYTVAGDFDWAFCTPVQEARSKPWGIYVAGQMNPSIQSNGSERSHLEANVKFAELVAEIISSVKRLNTLERRQAGLRQFFAPPILSALGDDLNTELLEPRECDVTVMFCDLRGFSQQAEGAAGDLIGLLNRVSQALGVMTLHILRHGGVTGDFQGDAALGFWGWPIDSDDSTLAACRAALGIRKAFSQTYQQSNHPLANFQMGIGIAHGRAVAGKIGTSEQVKVTVFGPVVNLASRLEGMTSQLRVPIIMDEKTANLVRERMNPSEGRARRLAKVLPFGLETPVLVSELVPPESDCPELTTQHLQQYDQGVDCFIAGDWEKAYQCLHTMPATDRAQDFLTMLIAQQNRVAPSDWDGVVTLANK